jgi:uncharacterized protein with HEPN domain
MQADDAVRIRHMTDAVEDAIEFVQARSRVDLGNDKMLQFALVRAIEVIGEAARKVSAAGRAELPLLSWAAITGMRNRLIHAYLTSIWISCGSPQRRRFRSCVLN